MKILAVIDLDQATPEQIEKMELRRAARAVVFDREGRIALLHVTKKDFYKLPGGGVEEGEDFVAAVKRERA